MKYQLSLLERIQPYDVLRLDEDWFGAWLMDPKNLVQLSTLTGSKFAYGPVAGSRGAPRSCIVLHDVATRQPVYIHPRVDVLNEAYLANLFRYLTQCDTGIFLWVATEIDDKLKETIRWLNVITKDSVQFFALRVEFWRIGTSVPAPTFHVECAPIGWHPATGLALPVSESVSLTPVINVDEDNTLEFGVGTPSGEDAVPDALKLDLSQEDNVNVAAGLAEQSETESVPVAVEVSAVASPEPLSSELRDEKVLAGDEAALLDVKADVNDAGSSTVGEGHIEIHQTMVYSESAHDGSRAEADQAAIATRADTLGEIHAPNSTPDRPIDSIRPELDSSESGRETKSVTSGSEHPFSDQAPPSSHDEKVQPRGRRTSFLEGFLQRARGRSSQQEDFPVPPVALDALADPPALRGEPAASQEERRWPRRYVFPVPAQWPDDLDTQLEVITHYWKELNDLIAQRRGALRPTLAFPQMWITFPTGHPDYVLAAELNPEAQVAQVKLRLSGNTNANDFAILEAQHQQIESQIGQSLLWQHNADERVICAERHGVDITSPRDWRATQQWMAEVLEQMYQLVTRWVNSSGAG